MSVFPQAWNPDLCQSEEVATDQIIDQNDEMDTQMEGEEGERESEKGHAQTVEEQEESTRAEPEAVQEDLSQGSEVVMKDRFAQEKETEEAGSNV